MTIIPGFLTGLSVGVYCLGICLPIFIPILLAEKRKTKESFWLILEFSLGRLLGYLLFGFIVGYLGMVVQSRMIHQIVRLSTSLMGVLMIGYSLGLTSWWGHKACKTFFHKLKIPILLGFLTGINVCPPFLASLTYVFNLQSVLLGVLLSTPNENVPFLPNRNVPFLLTCINILSPWMVWRWFPF